MNPLRLLSGTRLRFNAWVKLKIFSLKAEMIVCSTG